MDSKLDVGMLGRTTTVGLAMASVFPFMVVRGFVIHYASQAALHEFGRESADTDLVGEEVQALVHPDDRLAVAADIGAAAAGYGPQAGLMRRFVDHYGETLKCITSVNQLESTECPSVVVGFIVAREPLRDDRRPIRVRAEDKLLATLSPRQREVALLLCRDLAPSDIAARLGVSLETTRTHLKAIYERTGVCSRVDLARLILGG